jgi:hypothetical protein
MKRKTKGKGKKLGKRTVYFIIIIIFLAILIVLILRKPDEVIDEVIIKKLEFEDIGEDVYVKFDVENPTNKQKTCLINIILPDKKYGGYLNISAKSKRSYKTLVDMPSGKTEVRLDYICS